MARSAQVTWCGIRTDMAPEELWVHGRDIGSQIPYQVRAAASIFGIIKNIYIYLYISFFFGGGGGGGGLPSGSTYI